MPTVTVIAAHYVGGKSSRRIRTAGDRVITANVASEAAAKFVRPTREYIPGQYAVLIPISH